MSTGGRLAVGGGVVALATAYVAYLGAMSDWRYYLTVDECVNAPPSLFNQRVRVSGRVASESLQVAEDRQEASFALEGGSARLNVVCTGPLPDNLAEQIDVVVEGRIERSNMLRGDKVLTRCASKYSSQELAVARGHSSRVSR